MKARVVLAFLAVLALSSTGTVEPSQECNWDCADEYDLQAPASCIQRMYVTGNGGCDREVVEECDSWGCRTRTTCVGAPRQCTNGGDFGAPIA